MKITALQNLYKQSQIPPVDYEGLYFKLWLTLVSWVKNSIDINEKESDRKIVNYLKKSERFYKLFLGLGEFEENLCWLARSLEETPFIDNKRDCVDFSKVKRNKSDKDVWFGRNFINRNGEEQEIFYFSKDYVKVFEILIEVLYQQRCDLFHGSFYENENGAKKEILIDCYNALNLMLSKDF